MSRKDEAEETLQACRYVVIEEECLTLPDKQEFNWAENFAAGVMVSLTCRHTEVIQQHFQLQDNVIFTNGATIRGHQSGWTFAANLSGKTDREKKQMHVTSEPAI